MLNVIGSRTANRIFLVKSTLAQRANRRALVAMRAAETLPVEELLRQQLSRAMDIASLAYHASIFYRRFYETSGISEADLGDPSTFAQLPILSKDDIRKHRTELVIAGAERFALTSSTGGSTGQPMSLLHDRRAPVAAMWWRAHSWWGVGAGEHSAFATRAHRTGFALWMEKAQWWPTKHVYLNARGMSQADIAEFLTAWNATKPSLLTGYVEAVHQLAEHVQAHDLPFEPPTAIAVTASVLRDSQRRKIEDSLNAPVYDCYRSAEVPWIAAQCSERDGLHVMADQRIVEILDKDGHPCPPGEIGDVIVTDLTNRVFPLLRYRIGDRASWLPHPCACGRTFPLISAVDGREFDLLRGPTGEIIAGGLSAIFHRSVDAVDHFQLIQNADYSVVLRYVPSDDRRHAARAAEEAARDIAEMLSGSVGVTIESVQQIEHQGGKSRLVISHLT